jgi:hypothetical protein
MSKKPKTLLPQPWHPVPYDDVVTNALKALDAGIASAGQQTVALRWIVEVAAGTYDMSYRPGADGQRDTDFAEGRRFVGNSIVKQLKLRLAAK